nr:hybrid signal transduction histidine kinase b [Quercus suber]
MILRSLCQALEADLAMVSLLDETTQYFLAGATRDPQEHARISIESARWYGCDSVLHAGGLCARTLRRPRASSVYEVLDMAAMFEDGHLRHDDDLSRFRHYAGTSLISPSGFTIGTVFIFGEQPALSGLSSQSNDYLVETAVQVMKQLDQAVKALEYERVHRFSMAFISLNESRTAVLDEHASGSIAGIHPRSSALNTASVSSIYDNAANILKEAFDLDGVLFQDVRLWEYLIDLGKPSAKTFLSKVCKTDVSVSAPLPDSVLRDIAQCWPSGEICYRAKDSNGNSSIVVGTSTLRSNHDATELELCSSIDRLLPNADQVLVHPLWDPFHDRVVAVFIGFVGGWQRVYTRHFDVAQINAFCMSVINTIRRQESKRTEQQKVDFVSSVTHEMRSPLHGTLANLEILLDMDVTDSQRDILNDALLSGEQLLENIDKILEFSHITGDQSRGTKAPSLEDDDRIHQDSLQPFRLEEAYKDSEVIETDFAQETESIVLNMMPISSTYFKASQTPEEKMSFPRMATPSHLSDPLTVPVLVDTDHPRGRIKGYSSIYRKILGNLLSNSLKYTTTGCIRVSLDVDLDLNMMTLRVADCGIGISEEFLQNKLFQPFTQQNQLHPGTGLGLCVVKRLLDSINGTIFVHSSTDTGTTVTSKIPFLSFLPDKEDSISAESTSQGKGLLASGEGPSFTYAQLCTKLTDTVPRDIRCRELLMQSLTRTFDHLGVHLRLRSAEAPCDFKVLFLSNEHGNSAPPIKHSSRLVLRSDSNDRGEGEHTNWNNTFVGVVLPSRLPEVIDSMTASKSSNELPIRLMDTEPYFNTWSQPDEQVPLHLRMPLPKTNARDGNNVRATENGSSSEERVSNLSPLAPLKDGPVSNKSSAYFDAVRYPVLLLVDDNAINLKVLANFTSKCAIASSASAPGGQEAIDAYTAAAAKVEPGAAAFDVIFMDLSMPDVNGFQATSAIRRLEAKNPDLVPAYIIALTGLVSEKDRRAALDAGVDEYITKPAKLADVKKMVDEWSSRRK